MDKPASTSTELESIRQEIDSIDKQLVDLLCQRFAASEKVKQAKEAAPKPGIPYRPGREAIILRLLLERAAGRLPQGLVEHVWRAIISSSTRLQADVRVVTTADVWADARYRAAVENFASMLPVSRERSLKACIGSLSPDKPVLAVVPIKSGWVKQLRDSEKGSKARVVGVLPGGSAKPGRMLAVLGFAISEATGEDETLVVGTGKLPRDFVPRPVWTMKLDDDVHLSALPGYHEPSEQPLVGLKGNTQLQLQVAGRYPVLRGGDET